MFIQAMWWRERRQKATGGWGWTLTLTQKPPMKPKEWLKEWLMRCVFTLWTASACLVTVRRHSLSCQSVSCIQVIILKDLHILHVDGADADMFDDSRGRVTPGFVSSSVSHMSHEVWLVVMTGWGHVCCVCCNPRGLWIFFWNTNTGCTYSV